MAAPRHEMQTAFVHHSMKCWVYLEATMNHHLRHLVKRTPGIVLNYSGFISEFVDSSEGLQLLKMQHRSSPEVGKWAQVRKGIYMGDVGYITSIKSEGVEILAYRVIRVHPTLVLRPHYSRVRLSTGFTTFSLLRSKKISTHFEGISLSMG